MKYPGRWLLWARASRSLLQVRAVCRGVNVFRTSPVAIRDGLDIFLSSETLAWGDGLRFLEDLISINLQSAAAIMDKGPLEICVAHDWLGLWGGMAVKREGLPLIYHVHGL